MARKGYPFSIRDERYGSKLISSLFAVPLSLGASFLFSSLDGESNLNNSDTFELFKEKHLTLRYIIINILAILCPVAGMITYTFLDWWMFFSILIFGTIGVLFSTSSQIFVDKIRIYYIYDKMTYTEQIDKCKSLLKILMFFNIVYLILSTYPFISMILYCIFGEYGVISGIYLIFWNGGLLPGLMMLFSGFMCLLSFMPLYETYNAFKHFDEYIAENPSIKNIMKQKKMIG